MNNLSIKTNNVPRDVVYGYELTETEAAEFDYMEDINEGSFARYKGVVYDLGDFMIVSGSINENFPGWDGYASDSFFSGVLVKYTSKDFDQVVFGWYCS